MAFSFARESETTVELLHVVSAPQHELRLGSEEAVSHAVELGNDLVDGLADLGRSSGINVETDVVVSDHPERAIVERAQESDLVVVSSNRRAVTQRAFFGHRVDHILSRAN